MNWYRADLHVHSVLSPCSGLEMSPKEVIKAAKDRGINILAITDHNSMANCSVYQKEALKAGITFLWGVEIQTSEEIHIIALFTDQDTALDFDTELYESLLPIENNPEFFGDQVVIDENEDIVRFEKRALINSSQWSLNELITKLNKLQCFYFPAHIDAEAYSIIGQLGFIPAEHNFIALGITAACDLTKFLGKHSDLAGYSFIRSSDAHYLAEVGKGCTEFYLETATLEEMRLACQKKRNRKNVP